MIEEIKAEIADHQKLLEAVASDMSPQIAETVKVICDAFKNGNKLLVMGNGGSAADSQHFAAELVSRFKMERGGLAAIALSTDTSILSAIGNDYGFDYVFRRQVEALGNRGDVVVGISTSGNSANVYEALKLASQKGCKTVSLLGRGGGKIKEVSDIALILPSDDTPRIQEGHITIIHILCSNIEKKMFAEGDY